MSDGVEGLLIQSTIGELSTALRRRDVLVTELVRASFERLQRLGPRFNAVANLTRERALDEALRAERELARGRVRGPLHGIPYGAKDLLSARGAPTTWGAEPFRDQVIDHDATVVRKLQAAGAILVGKLAMVALAGGGSYRIPSASLQGPGRNPWNTDRWTGGSSSGSGAAVAARLVPFALGSETSGSIVTPSAFCGVNGLRPTYGLVSRAGAMALSWTLDKIGPMATSAEDCGLVLAAIAGRDAADPTTVRAPAASLARPVASLRLGFARPDFEEHAHESVRIAVAEALQDVRRLDAELREIGLAEHLPYAAITNVVISAEASSALGFLSDDGRIDQLSDKRQVAGFRAAMKEVNARSYLDAMRLRTSVQSMFRELFRTVDVIVAPTRLQTAPPVDQPLDATRVLPEERIGTTPLIQAGNAAGLPALAIPCGFGDDGLPVGLQLVGPPFSEPTLVAVASAYQAITDWHRRVPPGVE
jgi:aspartyl-tRNA(Asn)/glutamyl-tRNA(Gln) amidotransferase subunit A